jgi:hypothetical protein
MEADGVPLRRLPVPDRSILCKNHAVLQQFPQPNKKYWQDREIQQIQTSETGLCDGSDKCGGKEPEWTDLAILSLALSRLSSARSFTHGDGISFISHSVAASFLADTGACAGFVLAPWPGYLGDSTALRIAEDDAGDREEFISLHVGTGVLDPPLLPPTSIALLNL